MMKGELKVVAVSQQSCLQPVSHVAPDSALGEIHRYGRAWNRQYEEPKSKRELTDRLELG